MPWDLHADVVVVGGGLAGTWAALAAARQGGTVVLAEKGYCGTSGVTATAGVGHWWVPPREQDRAEALRERQARAFGLGEESWMRRVLAQTWELLPTIGETFRFPTDDDGATQYRTVRGPEYLRAMRRLVRRAGVRILDHSPVLELLVHADGSVAGVHGVRRQPGEGRQPGADYRVAAGAVVLATGGCGFASRLLGSQNNTGDGYLMAVEAGAELSGMEFSNYYTLSPAWSTMTRSMSYLFGTYFDADGQEIPLGGPLHTETLARAMLAGPVYTRLDRTPQHIQRQMPRVQPNFMLPFDRKGINPYTDLFEVTLRCEGTIRGTGGLRIVDDDCATTVPGLFAAGDAATRELVAGATSGGGAQNSAWALSSGTWAGRAAVA
ncbi:FAD-dependent oxidoreductase, partial [Frankia sp. CiP1_Cm_nod1]|uniref:FAD-dependent oxidoreductase n=1 Tax=Frankia sp. CiP1_Cm_nod1 TaxID=2897160 RepID=UPI004043F284